jgi:hypothetical protein
LTLRDALFKFISVRRASLPRVAPHSAAYRIVGAIGPLEPDVTEFVLVGKRRTEINLSVFGPSSARIWVAAQTMRLTRILVKRTRS